MIRLRPIRKLYFKHIQGTEFDGLLDAHDVARCFADQALIVVTENLAGDERYFETEFMQEYMPQEITLMLRQFLTEKKLKGAI